MFARIGALFQRWAKRNGREKIQMENQKLTSITRGLQHAAAETNALVADQYIRILSQYFEHDASGALQAKMVRVQLDDSHYANVPLVAMVAPSGLALDRMRVELSIRLEGAEDQQVSVLQRLRRVVREDANDEDAASRADFFVSLSPRQGRDGGGRRPSDHVNIELEFRGIETPEAVMRVIDTYTNLITPQRGGPNPLRPSETDAATPPPPDEDDGDRVEPDPEP